VKGSNSRRANPVLTRAKKTAGALGASSLGQAVTSGTARFPRSTPCRDEHSWLFGTDNAVCSQCGTTVSKNLAQLTPP
jgi:hypothetical protein